MLSRRKAELNEEIRTHIEMAAQDLKDRGKSAEEAYAQARREFGNIPMVADATVSKWEWLWLEHAARDLKQAIKRLWRSPGYALAGILTVALGLGAVTFMLALVDSVLLKPVALPHPEQLVSLSEYDHLGEKGSLSRDQLDLVAKGVPTLSGLAEYTDVPRSVHTSTGNTVARAYETSPNFFSLLGVNARRGRVFKMTDARADVAVISYAFWRDSLHGDPEAIGQSLTVYGRLVTVIGVMPEGFRFPPATEDAPIIAMPFETSSSADGASAIARLRDGASIHEAEQEVHAVFARMTTEPGSRVSLRSYSSAIIADERPALLALLGSAVLFLLIACANIAILQIARETSRLAEMKLRSALGASRRYLVQQIIMESLMMSLAGAALGLLLALVLIRWTRATYGTQYPRFDEVALHPAAFLGCAIFAVGTALLAALAPSIQVLRANLDLSGTASRTVSGLRVSGALVITEVALTCTLLIATGLLLQAFRTLESTPMGFDPEGVTSAVLLSSNPKLSEQEARSETQRILDGLTATPGITAAATQTAVPFSSFNITVGPLPIHVISSANAAAAYISVVSPEYGRTMRTPVVQGRTFDAKDHKGTEAVCLVNQAFVQKFLAGRAQVLNQVVLFPNNFPNMPLTIVGVTADELAGRSFAEVQPTVFLNYDQFPSGSDMAPMIFGVAPQFTVRSTLAEVDVEAALRKVIKKTAPDMAIMNVEPMQASVQNALVGRQLALRLGWAFGISALLLAAIGIYGVLAYTVVQRQREIGIRMALGCSRTRSMLSVVSQSAVLVFAGLAIGLVTAAAAGRVLHSAFVGTEVWDATTVQAATGLLLLVCAFAAALPAWRASRVDPVEALRSA